jgi:hypothetical protein
MQCRFMIQRNVGRRDSTSNGIMRMYAINYIAIHSVDDECNFQITKRWAMDFLSAHQEDYGSRVLSIVP